jgi:hypothetical protein
VRISRWAYKVVGGGDGDDDGGSESWSLMAITGQAVLWKCQLRVLYGRSVWERAYLTASAFGLMRSGTTLLLAS